MQSLQQQRKEEEETAIQSEIFYPDSSIQESTKGIRDFFCPITLSDIRQIVHYVCQAATNTSPKVTNTNYVVKQSFIWIRSICFLQLCVNFSTLEILYDANTQKYFLRFIFQVTSLDVSLNYWILSEFIRAICLSKQFHRSTFKWNHDRK